MARHKEEFHSNLRRIARTSLIVLIGIILSKILGYTYRVIIARSLGPESYGLYSLAIMILGWVAAIPSMGLAEGLIRFIPLYRGKKEQKKIQFIVDFAITVSIISSIIAGVLMFFLAEYISVGIFHNPNLVPFIKIFSVLVPISILSGIFLSIIRAYERISAYSFIFNILQNVVKVAVILLMIYLGFTNSSIIFSHFMGILLMLVFAYLVVKYKISEVFIKSALSKAEKSEIKTSIFAYSWPLVLISILGSIFYWVDSVSIGYFQNVTQVGFYNAAVPIAALLLIAPELFMQLFFPLILREYSRKNFKLIKNLSQQVGKWIFILNLPVFIMIMLFPGAFLNILFGPQYIVAESALRFLAIGSFISSMFIISSNLLSMLGRSKLLLANISIAAVLNFLLNAYLVPRYGITGASMATMICSILLAMMFLFEANHHASIIPLRRKMLNSLFSVAVPTAILLLVRPYITINLFSLILIGAIFTVLYLALTFLTSLDENDIMILKTVKERLKSLRHLVYSGEVHEDLS